MRDQATALVVGAGGDDGQGTGMPLCPVTVITAAVLLAGRMSLGDGQEVFAARAGVNVDLIAGIEDGTRPAWDVPGPELSQVADALGVMQGEKLWIAVACDLLLTSVLSGDPVTAGVACTEALADLSGRANTLLRWAVTGLDGGTPLLSGPDRELLRTRAAELAASGARDAWVGGEFLRLFGGTE